MTALITFDPFFGWVDIIDANNIPQDARVIKAADLLRYENFGKDAAERLNALDPSIFVAKGDQWVSVKDYLDPARVEGTTDDKAAFDAAIATGKKVYIPEGTYWFSASPVFGDNLFIRGAGKLRVVLKLLNSATADANLFVNKDLTGNVQGYIADFTVDGNCQRQGGVLEAAGGSRSSTMTFRNVRHFYVDRVASVNSIQHGFDVTRGHLDYAYLGDGTTATLRSSDVYFDQCSAFNFGDDGFTTHSSDYVHFSRSIAYSPRLRGNCNGFEIDGDSRYCTLTDNRTYNCYAGIEIKGHGTESAAQYTEINGHTDTGSVRSYNFRHIGYQTGSDPVSLSAFGITATNLVSIDPNNDAGFQDDASPRALSVSAYQGVVINGFLAKGRGGYGAGDIAVQVQYRASAVINGLSITGWAGAELDISLTTSGRVALQFAIYASATAGVYVGSTVASAKLDVARLTAPAAGGSTGIDIYSTANVELYGAAGISGYTVPIRADLSDYATVGAFLRKTASVPAGVVTMKALDPSKDYYASTAVFATFTTDRPAGITGAHFIEHSRIGPDVVIQTITRNTGGTPTRFFRILYPSNGTGSVWQQVTTTAVAYSAT